MGTQLLYSLTYFSMSDTTDNALLAIDQVQYSLEGYFIEKSSITGRMLTTT